MKLSRTALLWFAGALFLLGSLHSIWRIYVHQVPLFADAEEVYWDIEARVEFEALGQPVQVKLALPESQPGFVLQAEQTASAGYGLTLHEGAGARTAEWTLRHAEGAQWLYYKAQFQVDQQQQITAVSRPPAVLDLTWSAPLQVAASQLLSQSWQESADAFSLAQSLVRRLQDSSNQNAQLLLSELQPADLMVRLLNEADIPARVLYGLKLEDARRRQSLQPLVQVFEGEHWQLFNPVQGDPLSQDGYLLWQLTSGPILEVKGGRDSRVSFSMLASQYPASTNVHTQAMGDALMNLSIYSLPVSEQAVFKTLLLIPLGALVVVALRILVGLQTSGTFMPVLMALAFLEMSLLPGILTFLLIVGAGLVLRQLLASLNLLLVARVAAVIVCVIGLMAFMTVISYHAGISEGMQITVFPMIILAWTIERMSILWEEEGGREVLVQGGGSLLTAVLAFFLLDHPLIRYWLFNFPGLQLIIMAALLIIGSYTGYRLLELWRFRPLLKAGDKEGQA